MERGSIGTGGELPVVSRPTTNRRPKVSLRSDSCRSRCGAKLPGRTQAVWHTAWARSTDLAEKVENSDPGRLGRFRIIAEPTEFVPLPQHPHIEAVTPRGEQ